ncbi:hypothetical protein [Terrisporobacter sp.]
MKKTSNKKAREGVSVFKYIVSVLSRLLKISIQSIIVCFPVILTLVIINSLLGVHIRFSYYFKLAILSTLIMIISLIVLKSKSIFSRPVKKVKKTVPAKTNRKVQRSTQRRRKRIS